MRMRRLFLKVFLGFWTTVILVALALIVSFLLTPGGRPAPHPNGAASVHPTFSWLVLHWVLVLLVSGAVCYVLSIRLTAPILRLREASRAIAQRDLQARIAPVVARRKDEFGDLARDFNTMAERIENLVGSQRQLISDVSHELRSPLARMEIALDLLRRRGADHQACDRIYADLTRLEEIVGRLLQIARLESGGDTAGWEKVDLNLILDEVVADAELEARPRGCAVLFQSGGPIFVTGDEAQLRSALENVARNAVYYTDPGTEIMIALTTESDSEGNRALVTIGDRGPGVPDSDLENIFAPFYRVDDARARYSGGVGLGLAIAFRVIQMHRGTITAQNRAEGGLQVSIRLPAL